MRGYWVSEALPRPGASWQESETADNSPASVTDRGREYAAGIEARELCVLLLSAGVLVEDYFTFIVESGPGLPPLGGLRVRRSRLAMTTNYSALQGLQEVTRKLTFTSLVRAITVCGTTSSVVPCT